VLIEALQAYLSVDDPPVRILDARRVVNPDHLVTLHVPDAVPPLKVPAALVLP